ncbi:MAG: glutamine--fructose-6-phosphate transaminase (isomerizing) [Acetobacteraceae bacterium]|nr:glutamine--fructose-6-phosphate transaminase (isomerizing) [Acetobacteraceae bacterium]
MCGIVGFVGRRPALPFLLEGLKRLEYRGYDSAGVALLCDRQAVVRKTVGRIADLEQRVRSWTAPAVVGIGHTRWATHGAPTDQNAHPHCDCDQRVALVHNGIIENHAELRRELEAAGHRFASETDTEVIPHLLEEYLSQGLGLEEAVRRAASRLRGAFALAAFWADEPDTLVAARQSSPLIVGLGQGENYLASDIPAVMHHTRDVYVLEDGDLAVLTPSGVRLGRVDGDARPERRRYRVDWDPQQAERGGYSHFMLKEIHEQPTALRDTLRGRLDRAAGSVVLEETRLDGGLVRACRRVFFVACGTAYHAGLVGKHLVEALARVPAEVELASEFRYREPVLGSGDLVVVVSQSGETADSLASLREARAKGAFTLGLTNMVGSSLARDADSVLYTRAGPEIAVAATKTFTAQIAALAALALYLGQARGSLEAGRALEVMEALEGLPEKVSEALSREAEVAALARRLAAHEDVFFIGRGLDFALAQEGQLKLKEISYIHAEAYAAGELKHGTLALIQPGVPVIALLTQPGLYDKTYSNMQQVQARGGEVIALALDSNPGAADLAGTVMWVPDVHPLLAPVVGAVPLQLLAYYAGVERGCDVDKPRNLAKSVTVE